MMEILAKLGLDWPKILDLAFYLFDKAKELSLAQGVSPDEFNRLVDRREIERSNEIDAQEKTELAILEKK